mgnify:CR=1 FL=1
MSDFRVPIKVPNLGESLAQATLGHWLKQPGQRVNIDETLVELETDKVTLEVNAPASGILESLVYTQGQSVTSGEILAYLNTSDTANITTEVSSIPSNLTAGKEEINESPAPLVSSETLPPEPQGRLEKRVPLSKLRLRIAERLKQAQNTAAILTTFNEINLTTIQNLRQHYREDFEKKHGVKLGLMSFFVKAALQALQEIPLMNSQIDGSEIVYKNYYDIGIAVSAPQGLVVPIIRDANQLDYAGIEKAITDLSNRAKNHTLTIEDLSGGTFTISNGGIFGSLLSTPILNPPQTGILGLHKIQDRPIAVNGHVEIHPMMYLALSYDHRLIDGREAVTFLGIIKDSLENPGRFLLDL